MLSAETAVGNYPVQAVETKARIISFTETNCVKSDRSRELITGQQKGTEGRAIAEAAIYAANELRSKLIVVFSKSGTMARHLAALRPDHHIIAFTPHERTYSALSAVWGIEPRLLNFDGRGSELLERANQALLGEGLVNRGETIVVMAGRIPEQPSLSSMMKLHRIGEIESP
jgi:pyruvate kinase